MKKQLYILGLMSLLVSVGNMWGIQQKTYSFRNISWIRPRAAGGKDFAQASRYCPGKCKQNDKTWSGAWRKEGAHSVECACGERGSADLMDTEYLNEERVVSTFEVVSTGRAEYGGLFRPKTSVERTVKQARKYCTAKCKDNHLNWTSYWVPIGTHSIGCECFAGEARVRVRGPKDPFASH